MFPYTIKGMTQGRGLVSRLMAGSVIGRNRLLMFIALLAITYEMDLTSKLGIQLDFAIYPAKGMPN